jgi:hypothetical protein
MGGLKERNTGNERDGEKRRKKIGVRRGRNKDTEEKTRQVFLLKEWLPML